MIVNCLELLGGQFSWVNLYNHIGRNFGTVREVERIWYERKDSPELGDAVILCKTGEKI